MYGTSNFIINLLECIYLRLQQLKHSKKRWLSLNAIVIFPIVYYQFYHVGGSILTVAHKGCSCSVKAVSKFGYHLIFIASFCCVKSYLHFFEIVDLKYSNSYLHIYWVLSPKGSSKVGCLWWGIRVDSKGSTQFVS